MAAAFRLTSLCRRSIFTKATMVGNSSGTSGGAIDVGSQTGANGNILNMSFSRIVGNTGGGFTGSLLAAVLRMSKTTGGDVMGDRVLRGAIRLEPRGRYFDFDPWLQLRLTASPNTTPVVGESDH